MSIWKPPWKGWYKVNVDGAVFKESNCCCVGVVIRNERVQMMGVMCKKLELPLGALEVEAKAAEEGIRLARELSLSPIIIEGDSQIVLNAISSPDLPPSSIKKVIEGIKSWLMHSSDWKSNVVRRSCNVVAHLLARHAKFESECIIWAEDIPSMLDYQIQKDVTLSGFVPF
ncbi:hypothetical protein SO802_029350 [Lithocarpus litseifolius]|uniref:RNase H type-1 domain-containing protein n=1 Tax=Lithocarpus litseifolius TaxID=425828 RepID=A0AAW2BUW4_9ROSI